jgi:hypothetical protein
MNPLLITFLETATPEIIAFIKGKFAEKHPTEPTPSDEEVLTAWVGLRDSSLAKDDAFRREGT